MGVLKNMAIEVEDQGYDAATEDFQKFVETFEKPVASNPHAGSMFASTWQNAYDEAFESQLSEYHNFLDEQADFTVYNNVFG